MVGTDRWAVHCFRLALQPPRFPQAISALPKMKRRRAFDFTQGDLLAHSESVRLRDETECVVSTRCRVRSALQMDSSCDELEAYVPINVVLDTASPETFRE
jgi:hypothetical protein